MSDRPPTLRDCFKVKKGLCVTGDAYITGNLTLSGDFAWLNPDAMLTVGNLGVHDLSASRIHSNNVEVIDMFLDPDITITHPISVVDEAIFEQSVVMHDDLWVKGDLRVDGNAYLSAGASGTINVGDDSTDNVVFNADINSDIIPDSNITYDLGSSEQQWQELYVQDISGTRDLNIDRHVNFSGLSSGDLSGKFVSYQSDGELTTTTLDVDEVSRVTTKVNNTSANWDSTYTDVSETSADWNSVYSYVSGTSATNNLEFNDTRFVNITGDTMTGTLNIQDTLSAVGSVTFDSDLLVQGDLRVDGDVWFNANNTGGTNTIHMGDDNTDNIVFSADIDSNIIPNQDLVFDLGLISQRWNELFVNDISASGDTNVHDLSITGEIRNPSSVWSPSDLPNIDLISWHDAADVSTINLNGGTSIVTSIDDKSTNSYNLTKEGTGVDITTGSTVNMLNSVSAVEGASLTNSNVPLPEDHAFYIVAQVDTTDDGSDSLLSVKTGNSWQLDAAGASIFEARLLTTGIGFDSVTHKLAPGGGLNNQLALIRLTFNGSTDTVTGGLNGLNKFTQASYIDKQSPAEIRLFGNRSNSMFPDGIFSEMLIVSDVTQSTQDKIEGYLAHKWGLTLDSAHTYASATPTNTTPPVVVASSLSWPGGDSTQSNDTSMVVQTNSATWVNQPTVHTMTRSSLQITTPYGPTGELVSWTPTYSTGLSGWWDASDSTTITLDASNNITSWDDLAGSNNLTGQNDPQISSTLHNSLSVIDFDVENEHFISSTDIITLPTDGDVQFFIVCEPTGINDAFDAILSYRGNASNLDFQIDAGDPVGFKGVLRTRGLETGLGATSTAIPGSQTTGMNMFNAVFDYTGGEYSFRINSTQQGTAKTYDNKLAPSGTLGVFINRGGAEFPTGKVAEVLMTSDITENNRQTIEGYLAHKWDFASSLPSGHPYKNTAPTNSVDSHNPEFLAMQSDSSASDSKWADINYEHAMVLPYDATVKRVVLRGASTQGATVNVSVYSNRSETNANDLNFKFFPNTPIETTSQTFTTNNEGRLYTFSNTTSASMGRTLGISLSADQVIGHTNATIVLQYDT